MTGVFAVIVLIVENANGEIDENFWAQAAADRADMDGVDENGELHSVAQLARRRC